MIVICFSNTDGNLLRLIHECVISERHVHLPNERETDREDSSEARGTAGRFVIDVGDTVTDTDRDRVRKAGLEIVTDAEILGYLGVRGPEQAVAATGYEYVREIEPVRHGDSERSCPR